MSFFPAAVAILPSSHSPVIISFFQKYQSIIRAKGNYIGDGKAATVNFIIRACRFVFSNDEFREKKSERGKKPPQGK